MVVRRFRPFALAGLAGALLFTSASALAETPAPADAARAPQTFGAPLTMTSSVSFGELIDKADQHSGKTVRLDANISAVCRKKGCWMVLGDPTGQRRETIRITMKDYGFFVPKDCDGQLATVEGVFTQKQLSEAMAKHYAEDGGTDPAKETARKELTLVANGVEIRPAK